MIFIIFWLLGSLIGIITTILNPELRTLNLIATNLLFYQLTVTLTLTSFLNFFGQVFYSDKIAEHIGWEKGSGFQKELGYAALGQGIVALLCIWFKGDFWLAAIVACTPLYPGAAIVHFKDMMKNKNFNHGNSVTLIPDIIIPATLIVLFILARV